MEEQRHAVEKDVVRSSYRHRALRRTGVTGQGLAPRSCYSGWLGLMASDGLAGEQGWGHAW
jgi:hypothetical protein